MCVESKKGGVLVEFEIHREINFLSHVFARLVIGVHNLFFFSLILETCFNFSGMDLMVS